LSKPESLGGTAAPPGRFHLRETFLVVQQYSSADYSITPRQSTQRRAKIFDIYSWPYSIRPEIKRALGEFLSHLLGRRLAVLQLGPATRHALDPDACAMDRAEVPAHPEPGLPAHLDYNLQRLAPTTRRPSRSRAVDRIAGELLDFFRERAVEPLVLSEYGIVPSLPSPQPPVPRAGWLAIKEELAWKRSTAAPAAHLPWPITRSRIST